MSHCLDIAAQCPKCDKRFIHIDIMRIHMDTHHGSVALEEASDVLDCVDLTGEEDLFEHPDDKTFDYQKSSIEGEERNPETIEENEEFNAQKVSEVIDPDSLDQSGEETESDEPKVLKESEDMASEEILNPTGGGEETKSDEPEVQVESEDRASEETLNPKGGGEKTKSDEPKCKKKVKTWHLKKS